MRFHQVNYRRASVAHCRWFERSCAKLFSIGYTGKCINECRPEFGVQLFYVMVWWGWYNSYKHVDILTSWFQFAISEILILKISLTNMYYELHVYQVLKRQQNSVPILYIDQHYLSTYSRPLSRLNKARFTLLFNLHFLSSL